MKKFRFPVFCGSSKLFEQVFKNIDDILCKDSGCESGLDYIEQMSWILFLKYLNDFEKDRKTVAGLEGKAYKPVVDEEFCWDVWAVPRTQSGEIDRDKALDGDDLREFVNEKLFPYFKGFKLKATASDTIEYKIGEIFSELKNKLQSGCNLREMIEQTDALGFCSREESMRYLTCTKRKSETWEMPGATAENTIPRVH